MTNWKQVGVICVGIVTAPLLTLVICVLNSREIPSDQPVNGKMIYHVIFIHPDERVFYVICGLTALVVGVAVKKLATNKLG